VIDWNGYNDEQKLLVKERLRVMGEQVVSSKLSVEDKTLFVQTLKQVSVDLDLSESEQLLELLRKAAGQIGSPKDHGLRLMPDYQTHSLSEIKEMIDMEIHILSTATYRKNFKRGYSRQAASESNVNTEQKEQENLFKGESLNPSEVLTSHFEEEKEVQIQ